MRIRHKSLRDSRIAIGPSAFTVDSQGYLKPDPTPEQWRTFQASQKYFIVEAEAAVTEAPAPVEVVFAMPDPEDDLDRILADERALRHAAAASVGADDSPSEDDATTVFADDAADGAEVGFADDVEDLDAAAAGADDSAYARMTFEELKAACRHHGIPVARASRASLIERLKEQDQGS